MPISQKITTNLWFDNQAEEAAGFYVSIFKDSRTGRISYFSKEGFEIHRRPAGSVMTVEFALEGQSFLALNGGPLFTFNEAVSFIINCDTQDEIDYYWNKLTAGGDLTAQQCGWLKDKFGVSWQVVPTVLNDMITDLDQQKADRAMRAMLQMKKLDIAPLQAAYDGE